MENFYFITVCVGDYNDSVVISLVKLYINNSCWLDRFSGKFT